MIKTTLPLLALLTMTATGCGAATLAGSSQMGGRVRLEGRYMPAMSQARLLMSERCQGRFSAYEKGPGLAFQCIDGVRPAGTLVQVAQR